MSRLDVLVCGAGIAGSTLAYWLSQGGVNVTLVERAPELRKSGLGVDIRGAAVEVIRRMGLEDEIRSKTTHETGLAFVDGDDRVFAHFGVSEDNPGYSPTSDIEIMRGDLAEIISNAAMKSCKTMFGTFVESLSQDDTSVLVQFANGEKATFDMVIAADGLGSSTRKLVTSNSGIKSLGQYVAYFTLPSQENDGTVWKWYNAPGGRSLMTRPKSHGTSCAYLAIMRDLPDIMSQSPDEQKQTTAKLFEDAGWQAKRLIQGVKDSSDFYVQYVAQVKLDDWHYGRCCLVGDAAYCPSPISGMGTSLALLGGYVLAGEIVKNYQTAFKEYERILQPYVRKVQKLPPGTPALANPQTAWGIWILNTVLWLAAMSGIANYLPGPQLEGIELPDYKFDSS